MSLENQLLAERYQIQRLLARGGMADVYLATDLRLEREVAVKVIHPHLASDPRFTTKFIREAKTAAKLNHPNLVNVFDQGSDGGHTYMVMEYVAGMTLREALDKFGRLSPSRALELLEAILQGLAAAHRAGILHRDLKPENVFLADDGRIKLGDFGLAREADSNTSTGSLLGTIAYIAPELLTRGQADARSDVYSAGIMLYEFVTGLQPFQGTDVAHIAHQHTSVGVQAPSLITPSLPPLLDELVLWATAISPEHRPANAQVLVEVVNRVRAELKAGNGATSHLNLPQFSAATQVLPATDFGATTVLPDPNNTTVLGATGGETTVISTDAAADTTDQLHPLEEFAARRRRRAKWIGLVMVLSVLFGAGAGWWFSAGPGGMSALPNLESVSLANARTALEPYSAKITVVREFSNSVAKDQVVRTDPAGGALFWRGAGITLYVSKGPETSTVPSLSGLTQPEALAKLEASGFRLGSVSVLFGSVAKGEIIDFTGSDGNALATGSKISLSISAGPLPDLTGKLQPVAVANLIAAGAKPGTVSFDYSDAVATGAVISATPEVNPLPLGGKVNLVVSKGPTTVVVPPLKGETLAAAKLALETLGLVVTVNTDQLQRSWGIVKVKTMSVAAGTTVKRGSTVVISNR